jgi:ketosteroid isomerase-like protein
MQKSAAVEQAMQHFYARFSAGDVEGFAQTITSWPDAFVVGTDPGEWQEGRTTWIAGYEEQITAIPGIRLEAGDLRGYAEGSLGWAADRPSFVLPDGTAISTRLTTVLRLEDGGWKLVNAHFSIGVPNEEMFDLVQRWAHQRQATGG